MAVESYHNNRDGSYDFLLENSGGFVMVEHCSPTYAHSVGTVKAFGIPLFDIPSSPQIIIQVSQCVGKVEITSVFYMSLAILIIL